MSEEVLDEVENQDLIKVPSRLSIFLLSTLFSGFFGGIIYSTVLSRLDLKKHILGSLITTFVLTFLIRKLPVDDFYFKLLLQFFLNALIGLLIVGPFWNNHLKDVNYREAFAWIPMLVMSIIAGGLILLNLAGGL